MSTNIRLSPVLMAARHLLRKACLGVLLGAICSHAATGAPLTTIRQAGGDYSVNVISYREMPFRAVVHQQRDFSCGSAALATLLRYHFGLEITEEQAFAKMYAAGNQPVIRQVGFSLLDMKQYLATMGYQADGYRVPLTALLAKKAPSIVVVKSGSYKHFVVIKGFRDGLVLIGDPAYGLKAQTPSEFAKSWDGVVFLIHQPVADADRAFNRAQDWALLTHAPRGYALRQQPSASALTRELPPLYQVTTSFNANPR